MSESKTKIQTQTTPKGTKGGKLLRIQSKKKQNRGTPNREEESNQEAAFFFLTLASEEATACY